MTRTTAINDPISRGGYDSAFRYQPPQYPESRNRGDRLTEAEATALARGTTR